MKVKFYILNVVENSAKHRPFADAYDITAVMASPIEHLDPETAKIHDIVNARITFTILVTANGRTNEAYTKGSEFYVEFTPSFT